MYEDQVLWNNSKLYDFQQTRNKTDFIFYKSILVT